MEVITVDIDKIYVPVKRRQTLVDETVSALAENILEEGLKTPVLVRADGDRFILVEGLHRLEACRSLGEETIDAYEVNARLR
jgi:sulfiredoxin